MTARPMFAAQGRCSTGEGTMSVLVIGAGIGGLSCAIALRSKGINVDIIERDPSWSVYGVGIIQQANVVRAVAQLGVIDDYVSSGFGFDHVKIFAPNGSEIAKVPTPNLEPNYPANVGIGRPALQKVLGDKCQASGSNLGLGITVTKMTDHGSHVDVRFSNDETASYDAVIGADGIYSQTRETHFPDAPSPQFTGQSVWRYNFQRPEEVQGLWVYNGSPGVGLVPMSEKLLYMYVTTSEPGNPRFDKHRLAEEMRQRIVDHPSQRIRELAQHIQHADEVVYRPLEGHLVEGAWSIGRIALLGDAVHGTTPHLGQGAGLAIEDALVIADELAKTPDVEQAFAAYRDRRFERCAYIVKSSLAICKGQLGQGPLVDNSKATAEMFEVVAQPI